MIMPEFGFQGKIQDQVNVWLEPKENPIAVNILGAVSKLSEEKLIEKLEYNLQE